VRQPPLYEEQESHEDEDAGESGADPPERRDILSIDRGQLVASAEGVVAPSGLGQPAPCRVRA
jgi:hypothetical protein